MRQLAELKAKKVKEAVEKAEGEHSSRGGRVSRESFQGTGAARAGGEG
jgi:hypothetical protein